MKKYRDLFIAFACLITISLFLHLNYLNEFPRFIHAWTQSDRYALSLGFLENQFDFFHPLSFNLRPNPEFKPAVETGITPVEPPIPEYIVAMVMKLTGTKDPVIFRVYSIIISCLGLSALYLLLKQKGVSLPWRIGAIAFIYLSPVYFYYQAGFIPTTSALSFMMIGLYFFYSPSEEKYRSLSFLFFCLAALVRSPFILPLMIMGLLYFLEKRRWIPFVASVIVFAGFWLWNDHLASKYGSLFLRKLMHASSFSEFKEYLTIAWDNWITSYYTIWHYILAGLLIAAAVFLRKKKVTIHSSFIPFTVLWIIADVAYFIAMQAQFTAHDYYFLDSFFLPLVLLVVAAMVKVDSALRDRKPVSIMVLLIFSGLALYSNAEIQKQRRVTGPWDRTEITYQNFIGAAKLMDELSIPHDARVMVIDGYTINIPLIMLDRKGYSILNTTGRNIEDALTWNYDYVVIQDEYLLSDIVRAYPKIMEELVKIGGNGKISVYKREKRKAKGFSDFFGLSVKDQGGNLQNDTCLLNPSTEFACSFELPADKLVTSSYTYVLVSADVEVKGKVKDVYIVCDAAKNDEHIFYRSFNVGDFVPENEREKLEFMFVVPRVEVGSFKVFGWNPGGDDHVLLTNISVSWYHSK